MLGQASIIRKGLGVQLRLYEFCLGFPEQVSPKAGALPLRPHE